MGRPLGRKVPLLMAERQGFEPWIPVKVYTLSKRAPSATRPSLRDVEIKAAIAILAYTSKYRAAGVVHLFLGRSAPKAGAPHPSNRNTGACWGPRLRAGVR